MSIRDKYIEALRRQTVSTARLSATTSSTQGGSSEGGGFGQREKKEEGHVSVGGYSAVKAYLHQQILKQVDVARFDPERDREAFREAVSQIVTDAMVNVTTPLTREEKERLLEDTMAEAVGLGPLSKLFEDPAVSDILVNGPYDVFVERFGKLEKTDIRFNDNEHLQNLLERIVSRVGRHVDQHSPMVDARLPDGSRVNAIIPPLALNGPTISIRRFSQKRLQGEDLVKLGAFGPEMLRLFEAMVACRLNIMISGGTGSGKTTLLNVLSNYFSNKERIVTLEDAAELRLNKEHWVRLESRPANIEGKGHIGIRDLLVNCLRMRPDRIVVGECRGGEAFDMLQAMSTGHDGGLATLHSNSARDALKRLEAMVMMSGMSLPPAAIKQFIVGALDAVIHIQRLHDGSRKVLSISEIVGMEKDVILIQDIFVFQQEKTEHHDKVSGKHVSTGVRPAFLPKCELRGYVFDPAIFTRGHTV